MEKNVEFTNKKRSDIITKMRTGVFDVVVIGGGITGA